MTRTLTNPQLVAAAGGLFVVAVFAGSVGVNSAVWFAVAAASVAILAGISTLLLYRLAAVHFEEVSNDAN